MTGVAPQENWSVVQLLSSVNWTSVGEGVRALYIILKYNLGKHESHVFQARFAPALAVFDSQPSVPVPRA